MLTTYFQIKIKKINVKKGFRDELMNIPGIPDPTLEK